jgi:hypothetical protein
MVSGKRVNDFVAVAEAGVTIAVPLTRFKRDCDASLWANAILANVAKHLDD